MEAEIPTTPLMKFEHILDYWPLCQLTFINVWGTQGYSPDKIPKSTSADSISISPFGPEFVQKCHK